MEMTGIVQSKEIKKVLKISFISNTFLSIIKIIVGILGKSGALIADGIHSFSDLVTDVVAILGSIFARKPADLKHPYGHGRLEYLTSMMIGLVVLFLGFKIIYSGVTTEIVVPSSFVAFASLFTILLKYVLSSYILKKGKEFHNPILLASGKESRMDAFSSIVVLCSSILMQYSNKLSILKYADKVASIIVGCFIIHVGFSLLKENISIILGEQETNLEYQQKITNLILENENIKKVDSIVLIKYGFYYHLIGKVCVDGNCTVQKAHDIIKEVKQEICKKEEKIPYVILHINPYHEKN